MRIKVPVPVYMLMTEKTKNNMLNEIKQTIQQIKIELDQLQFQQKKLFTEAQKKGKEAVRIVQERIGLEHQKRKEKLERLYIQLEQVDKLNEGDKILYNTLETEVEVEIGQSWDEIFHSQEIVIKDGIIIDIGKGKED